MLHRFVCVRKLWRWAIFVPNIERACQRAQLDDRFVRSELRTQNNGGLSLEKNQGERWRPCSSRYTPMLYPSFTGKQKQKLRGGVFRLGDITHCEVKLFLTYRAPLTATSLQYL